MYKRLLINAKLKTGKRSQKTGRTGRSPLRRRKSAFDCSAIKKKKKKKKQQQQQGIRPIERLILDS
jgi:hypothetical protein